MTVIPIPQFKRLFRTRAFLIHQLKNICSIFFFFLWRMCVLWRYGATRDGFSILNFSYSEIVIIESATASLYISKTFSFKKRFLAFDVGIRRFIRYEIQNNIVLQKRLQSAKDNCKALR